MKPYLVQILLKPHGTVRRDRFRRVFGRDHRDAGLSWALQQLRDREVDPSAVQYFVLVAEDRPENTHPNGMPIHIRRLKMNRTAYLN